MIDLNKEAKGFDIHEIDGHAKQYAEESSEELADAFYEEAMDQMRASGIDRNTMAIAERDIKKAEEGMRENYKSLLFAAFRKGAEAAVQLQSGETHPKLYRTQGRLPKFALGQVVERSYSTGSNGEGIEPDEPALAVVIAIYDCLEAAIDCCAVDFDWQSYQKDPKLDPDELYYYLQGYGEILAAESQLSDVPPSVEIAVIDRMEDAREKGDVIDDLKKSDFKAEYAESKAKKAVERAAKVEKKLKGMEVVQ